MDGHRETGYGRAVPRRHRGLSGGLLLCAAVAGALLIPVPASAEQAKAGRFVQEGMEAMWAMGMALPDGDATIRIRTCDLQPRRAICKLRVAHTSYPVCDTVAVLHRRDFRFPARLWECPRWWRPVWVPMPDGLTYEERLEKALADRDL